MKRFIVIYGERAKMPVDVVACEVGECPFFEFIRRAEELDDDAVMGMEASTFIVAMQDILAVQPNEALEKFMEFVKEQRGSLSDEVFAQKSVAIMVEGSSTALVFKLIQAAGKHLNKGEQQ